MGTESNKKPDTKKEAQKINEQPKISVHCQQECQEAKHTGIIDMCTDGCMYAISEYE